jgi:hypothetical protein
LLIVTTPISRVLRAAPGETQFWSKPFPYGNFSRPWSCTDGNLNYYIGAQIANTGYVRDRVRIHGAYSSIEGGL